jgi:hypothetical protein
MSEEGPFTDGTIKELAQMDPQIQAAVARSGWHFIRGTQHWWRFEGVLIQQTAQVMLTNTDSAGITILMQLVFNWGAFTGNTWQIAVLNQWFDRDQAKALVQTWLDQTPA